MTYQWQHQRNTLNHFLQEEPHHAYIFDNDAIHSDFKLDQSHHTKDMGVKVKQTFQQKSKNFLQSIEDPQNHNYAHRIRKKKGRTKSQRQIVSEIPINNMMDFEVQKISYNLSETGIRTNESTKEVGIRKIRGYYADKQIQNSVVEFVKYLSPYGITVRDDLITKLYPHSDKKKSMKYVIHLLYNLVHQGLLSLYLNFMRNIGIREILTTLSTRYQEQPKSFIIILEQAVMNIYNCFEDLQKDGDIQKMIRGVYLIKSSDLKKEKQAFKCFKEIKEIFLDEKVQSCSKLDKI